MRPARLIAVLVAASLTLALAACAAPASSGGGPAGPGDDAAFPVRIQNAYGTTTIEKKPTRVATVAWMNQEVPLALGVVPVGMSKATWGDDDGDGVLPWVADRLKQLKAKTPVLFDETDGIDFEAVADTRPDVILAAYSGLSKQDYTTLSKIAPVVSFPDVAWGTSVDEMITLESKALGLSREGAKLIDRLDAESKAALDEHPQLASAKVLFAFVDPTDLSSISFYTAKDTRPGFLTGLGMPTPAIVAEESKKTDAFFVDVSSEQAPRFDDVDLIVTYGDPKGDLEKRLQADPLLGTIPAIKRGSVAVLPDSTPLAASANPSPLSIGWGIDRYFDVLAAALKPGA
ncbi:iron-siderophore ABC transporter substrate-binding protein [Pseudolysinimonas sp.]|uniref:iron-siderophore ABC transporter substrate-binding protein n=1 Tax=Pseudolysinimonas sp. TaxID=2680009 RepID=UPI003F7EDE9C